MKLYYSKGTGSLSIRMTLHEAGIQFTDESVDLKSNQTETGQNYLEINPKGAVPAITLDNGETLTESIAILIYLADHYGLDNLLPTQSTFERYLVIEWLTYILSVMHDNCSPLLSNDIPSDVCDAFFRPILRKKLERVELYLHKHVYLGGDTVCLADHCLFTVLRWMGALKVDITFFPALNRYFNQMKCRPAAVRSMQEEELVQV